MDIEEVKMAFIDEKLNIRHFQSKDILIFIDWLISEFDFDCENCTNSNYAESCDDCDLKDEIIDLKDDKKELDSIILRLTKEVNNLTRENQKQFDEIQRLEKNMRIIKNVNPIVF